MRGDEKRPHVRASACFFGAECFCFCLASRAAAADAAADEETRDERRREERREQSDLFMGRPFSSSFFSSFSSFSSFSFSCLSREPSTLRRVALILLPAVSSRVRARGTRIRILSRPPRRRRHILNGTAVAAFSRAAFNQ